MRRVYHFFYVAVSALLLSFLVSCVDDYLETGKSEFDRYEVFLAKKSAWEEPPDYTFTYEYRFGDSVVGPEFTVVVTDGVGVCTSNCDGNQSLDEFRFKSISEMYEHIDRSYQKAMAANPASENQYHFYGVSYKTEGKYTYPECWSESIGIKNMCGYGGDYIKIHDFSLVNHKTYRKMTEDWTEPEKPYSFVYDIIYEANGIYNAWSTDQITVTVAEDGTATQSFRNDSTENYDRFLSYFGDYEIFEDGLIFSSVGDFFSLAEKVWNFEEAKCDTYSNYRIKPVITTYTASNGLEYPHWVEIQSFLSNEYCGGSFVSEDENEDSGSTAELSAGEYKSSRFRALIWVKD